MTNGGSANFCPRESSIKVSQPLTKWCVVTLRLSLWTLCHTYHTQVPCACLKDQGWRKGGKDTLLYLHAALSPVRRFRDIWHYSHSNTVSGGGFRDSLADVAEELCPSSTDVPIPLPFFVRSPNQVNQNLFFHTYDPLVRLVRLVLTSAKECQNSCQQNLFLDWFICLLYLEMKFFPSI